MVARDYGRRDWFLRRLLAFSDVACLALAMAVAMAVLGGTPGHSWQQYLLYGLITLPAWVVLLKVYGLYERDAKRLSHSTLDDLPPLFHCLLLGCLLMWCWFVLVAPAKLPFATILLFAALAMVLVLVGRLLVRGGFLRVVLPERVLLIGTGHASGALIEKMRTKTSLGLQPIGMVSCDEGTGAAVALPRLGRLEEIDLPDLMAEHRVARVVVADVELDRERLLGVVREIGRASCRERVLRLV